MLQNVIKIIYSLELFYRSKEIKLSIGDIYSACSSMLNIARVQRKFGKHEEALLIYSACLRLQTKTVGFFTSELHNNIGNVFLDMGDYEKARFNIKNL